MGQDGDNEKLIGEDPIEEKPNPYIGGNQEGLDRELFVYMNTIAWIANFIRKRARDGFAPEAELQAQVEKDIKHMLDQKWTPH